LLAAEEAVAVNLQMAQVAEAVELEAGDCFLEL
jgi:hypothetical protein